MKLNVRTDNRQAWFQLAGMAVTIGIAILSAIVAGFIASRLPHPEIIHDDSGHFAHVEYGDDTAKFNIGHLSTAEQEMRDLKANALN